MKNFTSLVQLKNHFKRFKNLSLKKIYGIVQLEYPEIVLTTNKGVVGQLLEATTGRRPNSNPNPDIQGLNVELKVLPVRKIGDAIKPKERSKIKSINYSQIPNESWGSSAVRSKMELILFLVYEQPTGLSYRDWKEFVFKNVLLFDLKSEREDIIKEDWSRVKKTVAEKKAHLLSEGNSKILGACTSGSGRLVVYGAGPPARERSFCFKHSYMRVFYDEKTNPRSFSKLKFSNGLSIERFVVDSLSKELEGRLLGDVVKNRGLKFNSSSKSSFRGLINSVLKVPKNKRLYDLAIKNITIKTIPVNDKNKPWESMSFPKFSLMDMLNESWDEDGEKEVCVFKSLITQAFILIPVIKEKEVFIVNNKRTKKFKPWGSWKIGHPFFWRIKESDLKIVKREWLSAQKIVEKGVIAKKVRWGGKYRQENNLLKQSNTERIHIRPHAKNSNDIDLPFFEKQKIKISWQSFWLNKNFIEGLIRASR